MKSWWFRRKFARRQVYVNAKNGNAYKGILWDQGGGYIVLKECELFEPGAQPIGVDGEVAMLESNIEFIQFVNGG